MPGSTPKTSVVVLYNDIGDDEYEKLKDVDPKALSFEPHYDIQVATVAEEYTAIVQGLREEGFRVRPVNLRENLRHLERIVRRSRPDVIFNLVEFFHDDAELEPAVAGFFDLYRLPYTGSPPFALALTQRKGLTKQALLSNGVPTPRFRILEEPGLPRRHGLHYPLIIKPAREDASTGVEKESVVHDYAQLTRQITKVFDEFDPPILVEEFMEGMELHVAILGNDPPEMLPPIEWDFSDLPKDHPALISYNAKWNPLDEVYHRVHSVCPPRLPKRVLRKVEQVALRAYEVTGCRDYARLDIRLSKNHQPHVLEVNPNPDLTEGVSFMESAEEAGLTFSETLRLIVECALERREPEPEPSPMTVPESEEVSSP